MIFFSPAYPQFNLSFFAKLSMPTPYLSIGNGMPFFFGTVAKLLKNAPKKVNYAIILPGEKMDVCVFEIWVKAS